MHLFIQGAIRTGKSTIIRNSVIPYINDVGGYFVQRMFLAANPEKYTGFAVKPLSGEENYRLNMVTEDLFGTEGLFLFCNSQGKWSKVPGVFEESAERFLREAAQIGKRLIIMDELGGTELEDMSFFASVKEILDGGIPVLGVLKCPGNLEKLKTAAGEKSKADPPVILEGYDYIKHHPGVRILNFRGAKDNIAEKRAEEFVKGVFDGGNFQGVDR